MSVSRQVTVWCDVCALGGAPLYGQTDHIMLDVASVTEARKQAKAERWTRRGAQDICPAHSR